MNSYECGRKRPRYRLTHVGPILACARRDSKRTTYRNYVQTVPPVRSEPETFQTCMTATQLTPTFGGSGQIIGRVRILSFPLSLDQFYTPHVTRRVLTSVPSARNRKLSTNLQPETRPRNVRTFFFNALQLHLYFNNGGNPILAKISSVTHVIFTHEIS